MKKKNKLDNFKQWKEEIIQQDDYELSTLHELCKPNSMTNAEEFDRIYQKYIQHHPISYNFAHKIANYIIKQSKYHAIYLNILNSLLTKKKLSLQKLHGNFLTFLCQKHHQVLLQNTLYFALHYLTDWNEIQMIKMLSYALSLSSNQMLLSYIITLKFNDVFMSNALETLNTNEIIQFFQYLMKLYHIFHHHHSDSSIMIHDSSDKRLYYDQVLNWLLILIDVHFITLLMIYKNKSSTDYALLQQLHQYTTQSISFCNIMNYINGIYQYSLTKKHDKQHHIDNIVGEYTIEHLQLPC